MVGQRALDGTCPISSSHLTASVSGIWSCVQQTVDGSAICDPDLHLSLLLLERGCWAYRELEAADCSCGWSMIEAHVAHPRLAREDSLMWHRLSFHRLPAKFSLYLVQ